MNDMNDKLKKLIETVTVELLKEKSVSQDQQQAAGAALAAKRGDIPASSLKGASKEMYKMSEKELEKFAGTKHKGLPVKKESIDLSHDEDEVEMIKSDLFTIAKTSAELYKMLSDFDSPVDFPHWWQSKIVKAKYSVSAAKDYLEYEIESQLGSDYYEDDDDEEDEDTANVEDYGYEEYNENKKLVKESNLKPTKGSTGYINRYKSNASIYSVSSNGKKLKVKLDNTNEFVIIESSEIKMHNK